MTILFWTSVFLTAGGGITAIGRWFYAFITKEQDPDTPAAFTIGIICMSLGFLLFLTYLMIHMAVIHEMLNPQNS